MRVIFLLIFFILSCNLYLFACKIEGLLSDAAIVDGKIYKVNDSVCEGKLVSIESEGILVEKNGEEVFFGIGKIDNRKLTNAYAAEKKSAKNKESFIDKIKGFFKKEEKEEKPAVSTFQSHYHKFYEYYNQAQVKVNTDLRAALPLYEKACNEAKKSLEYAPKRCNDLRPIHKEMISMMSSSCNKAADCKLSIFKKEHMDVNIR